MQWSDLYEDMLAGFNAAPLDQHCNTDIADNRPIPTRHADAASASTFAVWIDAATVLTRTWHMQSHLAS
jgi:hypothetical protein